MSGLAFPAPCVSACLRVFPSYASLFLHRCYHCRTNRRGSRGLLQAIPLELEAVLSVPTSVYHHVSRCCLQPVGAIYFMAEVPWLKPSSHVFELDPRGGRRDCSRCCGHGRANHTVVGV